MTAAQMERFAALRRDLFGAIALSLQEDGHCKSYEGAMTIRCPNYFENAEGVGWQITLDCYVVGPGRHYHWDGRSFGDVLSLCEADVRRWIAEATYGAA